MLAATTTAPAPVPAAPPHLVRVGTVTIPAQPGPPARETIGVPPNVVPIAVPEAIPTVPPQEPATLLRVERGTATAEEIAAITAVLLARATAVRTAADAEHAAASRRRGAARWRSHSFAGPRAWTSHAPGLMAG